MGEQDTSRSALLLCEKKYRWKDRSRKRYFKTTSHCLDCLQGGGEDETTYFNQIYA